MPQLGHADTRMIEKHYAHLAPSYVAQTIGRIFRGSVYPTRLRRLRSRALVAPVEIKSLFDNSTAAILVVGTFRLDTGSARAMAQILALDLYNASWSASSRFPQLSRTPRKRQFFSIIVSR
jgi:hypothetical protein